MQVRVGFALRHDAFEIVLASQPEQSLAICVDVVAVQEPLALIGHNCMKPELAVDQGQILKVVSVPKSAAFLFTIKPTSATCAGIFRLLTSRVLTTGEIGAIEFRLVFSRRLLGA